MNNKKLEKFNSLICEKKSGWLEKANWREENQEWLDLSFEISLNILEALRKNKKNDIFPRTQKELAEAMKCSPQYISKVLKGNENLQLGTITKLGEILNITLIEVPHNIQKEGSSRFVNYSLVYKDFLKSMEYASINWDALKSIQSSFDRKDVSYYTLRYKIVSEDDFGPKSPLKVA